MVPQLKRKKLWYLPDGTVTETYQPGARSSPFPEPVGVFNPERFVQEQELKRRERLARQIKPTLPGVSPTEPLAVTLPQPTTPAVKETTTPELLGFDKALRKLYSPTFEEGLRLGEDPLKTTDNLLKQIQSDLQTNPDIFLNDLKTKYKQSPDETRALLRFFAPDITDEQIEQELNPLTDNRVIAALDKIPGFADYSLEDVLKEAQTDPDKFLTTILEGGVTTAERDLLRAMGVDEATIMEIIRTSQPGGEMLIKPTPAPERKPPIVSEELGYKPPPPAKDAKEREERAKAFRAYRKAGGKMFADQWELYGMPATPAAELPKLSKEERQAVIDRDVQRHKNLFAVFGQSLTYLPKQLGASILQAIQGQGGASVVDKDWADKFITDAGTDLEKFTQEILDKYGESDFPIKLSDIATLPQNIAYSLTSMGAGLAVGVPVAMAPVPGARIAAWGLGSAASGAVAYSMTTYQIMQQYLEAKDAEMRSKSGRGLTAKEEADLKAGFETKAREYGLWEAVPEAVSNLAFGKILTAPLSRVAGQSIAVNIVKKLVGMFGEEFLTETITQKGQSDVEIAAGLREGRLSWVEAFKEVAPQTFLLTTILGGAGQVSVSSVQKIKQSLSREAGDSAVFEDINKKITETVFDEVEKAAAKVAGEAVTPAVPQGAAERITAEQGEVAEVAETKLATSEVGSTNARLSKIGVFESPNGQELRYEGVAQAGFYKFKTKSGPTLYFTEGEVNQLKAKAVPAAPEVTKVEPSYVNLIEGQTLVNQAGERWTITAINKTGVPARWAYTIKIDTPRMKLTRTVPLGEIERYYKIEQPAIPKAVTPAPEVKPVTQVPGEPEAGIQEGMFGEQREVRPRGKGRVTQISMDEQLQLENLRRSQEAEGLKVALEEDPVANYLIPQKARVVTKGEPVRLASGKLVKPTREITRNIRLDSFIDLREQSFPEYFTVKQARQLLTEGWDLSKYEQKGTKDYNHVPRDVALEKVAQDLNMSADEVADRVMDVRRQRAEIRDLSREVTAEEAGITEPMEVDEELTEAMIRQPLASIKEMTAEEVTEREAIIGYVGGYEITLEQAEALALPFAEYVMSENAVTAFELQRALYSKTRAQRSQQFKARMQELIVVEGKTVEVAFNQAKQETLSGKLPVISETYLEDMTNDMREALFLLTYNNKELQRYPLEMASTITALTNALSRQAIPRKKGTGSILFPEGGSAWDRLNLVFGKNQPQVLKALDKMATEQKTMKDVVDGLFHEIGRNPIPIDQDTAEYLRGLETIVLYEPTILREPIPVAKFEAPIEDAFKQGQLWPRPVRDNIIRALKELGMLPVDIGNFLRANKASVDFSFWRQQAPLIASHPISFTQANIEAWRALWSQKSAEASWVRITRDPLYQMYEEAERNGGDFLRPLELKKGTSQYKGTEEFGYSKGVERKLPQLTAKLPWVKLSARAFETGTNVHNWLIFKSYYGAMLKYSEQIASGQKKLAVGEAFDITKEMVDFSKSLANFTARGSLGKFAVTAPELSGLFFAPRAAIGRILSVKDLVNTNPRIRLEAWKNASSFVGTFGGLILLGAAMGWWEVEKDPRNAEYMSIRIGNTRIDPWGGYRQFLVFFARAISLTGVSSVTGAEYEVDPINLIQTFIRGKASPLASLILDFWRGKTFIGEEVDVTNKAQWAERVAPFAVWDIYEAFKDDPIHGLQSAIPAILGAGVQTYTGDWRENFSKLGLPKYSENLAYGLTEPKYDTADIFSDTASQFKGVDPATLTKEKGFPDYVVAIVEAKRILDYLGTLPPGSLVKLNTDPTKGATFADYYKMWRDRQAIVASGDEDKLKEFDKDERTSKAHYGNFSQREFALLSDRSLITDKKKLAEFDKAHPELSVNLRQEWWKSNPKENALLAVFGQADLLTPEAYTEFKRLVKELDIPDSALPERTLPPEGSLETHWKREQMVADGKEGSWEAQLMLLNDAEAAKKAGKESYADWKGLKLSDTPKASLELKVKNAENLRLLDSGQPNSFGDKDGLNYKDDKVKDKDGLTDRDRAREQLYKDNPNLKDDQRRIEAIETGTQEKPTADDTVKAHVDYMKLGDTATKDNADSERQKLSLIDLTDPESPKLTAYGQWRLDNELMTEPPDFARIKEWQLDVKYEKEDKDYKAITEKHKAITYANDTLRDNAIRADQRKFQEENIKWRLDDFRRDAYTNKNKDTGYKLPDEEVEDYVAYKDLLWQQVAFSDDKPFYGEDRFLLDNDSFRQAMYAMTGADKYKNPPTYVPPIEYDELGKKHNDTYALMERWTDETSSDYLDDSEKGADGLTARQRARQDLKYDDADMVYSGVRTTNRQLSKFGRDDKRREGYAAKIPEEFIQDYVDRANINRPKDWAKNSGQSEKADKEGGTGDWFEDDWWMMEHLDYYQQVYLNPAYNNDVQRGKWDFRRVPTTPDGKPNREVFEKYLEYVQIKGDYWRDLYRKNNLDLDEWGQIAFGWKSIMKQQTKERPSARDRFYENLRRGQEEFQRALRGAR